MIEFTANVVRYDGNNSTTSFDYTFLIFSETDLQVYVDGVLQTLSSDYTVTGVNLPEGGTVEFAVPPPSGTNNVLIERFVPYTQTISIPEGSKFPARLVETGMDRIVVMLHQLFDKAFRGISLAVTAATGTEDLDISQNSTQRADRVIAFTSTGNAVTVGPTVAELESLLEATSTLEIPASNLRGRGSAGGTGPVENITLGSGLSFNGTVLEAATGFPSNVTHSRTTGMTEGLSFEVGPVVNRDNLNTVRLDACKYLVTDKGRVVTPRLNQVCDFDTVGAGGRDRAGDLLTGHRWWDLYYIFKDTDSVSSPAEDALLLSPSNVITETASFTNTLDSQSFVRINSATERQGQSFTTLVELSELHCVVVSCIRVLSPNGNIWLTIEADNGGEPSGTPLATSEKKPANRLSAVNTWQPFLFTGTNRVALANSTVYWIVMRGDFTIDGTNYASWNRVTAGGYTGGQSKTFDGASWSGGTPDNLFAVIGLPVLNTPVLPSGYTDKCHLGYVQTVANGTSLIAGSGRDREFIDKSAETTSERQLATPSITTQTWYASAFGVNAPALKPLPYNPSMQMTCKLYGISAAMNFGIGGASATDVTSVISTTKIEDATHVRSEVAALPSPEVLLQIGRDQGVFVAPSAGTGSVIYRTGFRW